jgi:hypothetical protein
VGSPPPPTRLHHSATADPTMWSAVLKTGAPPFSYLYVAPRSLPRTRNASAADDAATFMRRGNTTSRSPSAPPRQRQQQQSQQPRQWLRQGETTTVMLPEKRSSRDRKRVLHNVLLPLQPTATSFPLRCCAATRDNCNATCIHGSLCVSVRSWCCVTWPRLHSAPSSSASPSPATSPSCKHPPQSKSSLIRHVSEDLLREVLACIPRAPLCAKVTTVRFLLHQRVSTFCTAGPLRQHIGGGGLAAAAQKDAPPSRLSSMPPRLRAIQSSYASFGELLMSMSAERLKGLRSEQGAAEDEGTSEAEKEVYRGGGRYGIYLSCDRVFVTIASSALEAGMVFQSEYKPLTASDLAVVNGVSLDCARSSTRTMTLARASPPQPELRSGAAATTVVEPGNDSAAVPERVFPEDYCYAFVVREKCCGPQARQKMRKTAALSRVLQLHGTGVDDSFSAIYSPTFQDDFKPPTPPSSSTGGGRGVAANAEASAVSGGDNFERQLSSSPSNAFTPAQIGSLLPTYFVPMGALLAQLPPGYTPAHVHAVFRETGAVEVVQLGSETFVRFHGGKDMKGFSSEILSGRNDRFEGVSDNVEAPCAAAGGAKGERRLRRYMAAYKPDPYLLYTFLPCFTRPFQWVSLFDLVQHAPTAVQDRLLPLRQQLTLLYFAQQQQRVHFSPQNGGAVALCNPPVRSLRAETTPLPRVLAEVSILLRNRGVVYVEELEKEMNVSLSDYAKRHIIAYFGTLRRFLFQHQQAFRLSVFTSPTTLYEESAKRQQSEGASQQCGEADTQDIASLSPPAATTTTSGRTDQSSSAADDVSLPLPPLPPSLPRPGSGFMCVAHSTPGVDKDPKGGEDPLAGVPHSDASFDAEGFPRWLSSRDLAVQLEGVAKLRDHRRSSVEMKLEAVELTRQRMKVRKLRRHLAAQRDPNSPYHDTAVLLDAIVRYLPPKGHVSVKTLVNSLPVSMRDFLPNEPVRLFRNNPDKVQLFEYRRRNHLRVMRANLPLPDGRLRTSYTEEELLYLIAAELLPGQAKTASTVYGALPFWARETIRTRHRHMVTLLEQHPQNFIVVYKDAMRIEKHNARISLLQAPAAPLTLPSSDAAFNAQLSPQEAEALEKEERDALRYHLSPVLRGTDDSPDDMTA